MNRALRIILESLPWLMLAGCPLAAFINPAAFKLAVSKDSLKGAGWVENLTVACLLIAIVFGIYLLAAYWNHFRFPLLRVGIVVWILGCIYFAGEEISWGQWYFQWETPEAIRELNRQKEVNLHNVSSWFNEKPRTLLEIWMIFAGLVVALLRKAGRLHFGWTDWREWINPAGVGISTCAVFLICRAFDMHSSPTLAELGSGEVRELLIAYFLALFLFSVYSKLSSESTAGAAAKSVASASAPSK